MKKCAAWGWAHFALRIKYDLAGSALNQPASQPASQEARNVRHQGEPFLRKGWRLSALRIEFWRLSALRIEFGLRIMPDPRP